MKNNTKLFFCLKGIACNNVSLSKILLWIFFQFVTPFLGDWSHITNQIGMFSYTGLNPQMCEFLKKERSIYLLKSGRMSMCGVSSNFINKQKLYLGYFHLFITIICITLCLKLNSLLPPRRPNCLQLKSLLSWSFNTPKVPILYTNISHHLFTTQ